MPFFVFLVFLATLFIVMVLGFVVLVRELGLAAYYLAMNLSAVVAHLLDSVGYGIRSVFGVVRGTLLAVVALAYAFIYVVRKIAALLEITTEGFVAGVRTTASSIEMAVSGRGQGHREQPADPGSIQAVKGRSRFGVVTTLRSALACWFAPTCVLGIFVALSGAMPHEWVNQVGLNRVPGLAVKPVELPPASGSSRLVIDNSPTPAAEPTTAPEFPSWVTEPNVTKGDVQHYVLKSQLWSTQEEARRELLPQATALVRRDFDQRHKGLLDSIRPYSWNPDRIFELAVKRQFVEHVQNDFGNFNAGMNRVYWQVELSPVVRSDLYPEWRTAVTRNRMLAVGAALSLLTLLSTMTSTMTTLRRKFQPRRVMPYAVPAFSAAAWVAAGCGLMTQLVV